MLDNPRTIRKLDSVDSTNNYAANPELADSLGDNTVILAREQREGRGQRGKEWSSHPGLNLTFSWIRRDTGIKVDEQFYISKAISLGIVDALREAGITAFIKWPNDILVGKNKIAGILIENQLKGQQISRSIIGVGLNVNQFANLPKGSTSIRNQRGCKLQLDEFLSILLDHLDKRWVQLRINQMESLDRDYDRNSFLMGKQLPGNSSRSILGTNKLGQLLVGTSGEIQSYNHGEIDLTPFLK